MQLTLQVPQLKKLLDTFRSWEALLLEAFRSPPPIHLRQSNTSMFDCLNKLDRKKQQWRSWI
jgi:hypothetical protein